MKAGFCTQRNEGEGRKERKRLDDGRLMWQEKRKIRSEISETDTLTLRTHIRTQTPTQCSERLHPQAPFPSLPFTSLFPSRIDTCIGHQQLTKSRHQRQSERGRGMGRRGEGGARKRFPDFNFNQERHSRESAFLLFPSSVCCLSCSFLQTCVTFLSIPS